MSAPTERGGNWPIEESRAIESGAEVRWNYGMSPHEPAEIKRYLLDMQQPATAVDTHRVWVESNLQRFLRTLSLVPPGAEGQRCLEIGSMPYTFTLLMKKFRPYELTLVDYYPGAEHEHCETVTLPTFNEQHRFLSHLCDVERDELPFPAHSFDGVLCCEVLEHLTVDPVAMLAEIHRLLKPDGWLIVTTPHVANLSNILHLLHGRNIYGRYELVFGPTWRHNREYTCSEVVELLRNTGYRIEHQGVEDVHAGELALSRRLLRRLLHLWYRQEYGDQVYVRARREAVFRWDYPPWLFEHADLHVVPRFDYVRVGENDALQLGLGWSPRDRDNGSEPARTIVGECADAYIKTRKTAARLAIELYRDSPMPQPLHIEIAPHPTGDSSGEHTVEVTLQRNPDTVLIDVPNAAAAAALRIRFQRPSGTVALRTIQWSDDPAGGQTS